MNKSFFLHEPKINNLEKKEVLNCLNSGWISPGGANVESFEKKLSKYTRSKVVLTNSGTSSLHLSLILSKVKRNDEVLVPTITFIATVNAILYLGASPIFFDTENDGLNCDVKKILFFLQNETFKNKNGTFNIKTKKRIKALIFTHVFGDISDLNHLKKELKKRKIKLIEDAAEAVGSFNSRGLHAGTQGDYGVLSFNTNKIITTSAGGAILLKSNKDYKRTKILISQGKINNVFFVHNEMGFNYGMTNINASIGLGQLKNLNKIILKKQKIHKIYSKNFEDDNRIKLLKFDKKTKSNFWLNSIIIEDCNYKKLNKIINEINKKGIQVRPLWYPCHKQNFLKKYQKYKIKNAENVFKKLICLPSSYFLDENHINYISKIVKNVIKNKI
jgi:perosamine synthetase